MRFRVLGATEVVRDDAVLDLGQPKARLVWAVLLCRMGRVVSDDVLVDAVWGDEPPQSAVANLRVYVGQLRRTMGDGVIVRRDGGYVVPEEAGASDAAEFEELVTQARAADAAAASGFYERALGLWRGQAFGQFGDHPAVASSAQRLAELRLAALEEWLDVRLELGEHAVLVAELANLVAAHPLREGFARQWMLALYRSGRQAEALAAFQQVRRVLAEELGVDPGSALRELYQAIVSADPALDMGGRPVTPGELPADVAYFVGRDRELTRLRDRLLAGSAAGPVVAVISGSGGAGKTALAVRAAHQVKGEFPDGQLYVNLQGYTPDCKPLQPIDALGRLLRSLGTDGAAIPTDVEEAATRFRTLTHERQLLIVLDNAYNTAQVRPLLPGTGSCAVIVTSRRAMPTLTGADGQTLDVLPPDQARELLSRLIGPERAAAEPAALATLAGRCGNLPLAISIAAARLNARTSWTLAKLAGRLDAEDRRLTELAMDDRAVRAALEVSYRDLDYLHSRAFRLCALPGGPYITPEAAAALLDHPEPDAEDLLDSLVDHGLLVSNAAGRYHYHDLLRLFSLERGADDDQPDERNQALHRLLAFYTATTQNAVTAAESHWAWPQSLLPAQYPARTFAEGATASAWLHDHAPHLIDSLGSAATQPASLGLAADLLFGLEWLRYAGADWRPLESIGRRLAESAAAAGDHRSEAMARCQLGSMYYIVHDLPEAEIQLRRAAEADERAGDLALLAQIRQNQGLLYSAQRRLAEAIDAKVEAASLYAQCDRPRDEALALSNLARDYQDAGSPDRSLDALERATVAAERAGSTQALGYVCYQRGVVQRDIGDYADAIVSFDAALRSFREIGNQTTEGIVLYHLAEAHRRAEEYERAIRTAEECLELGREIADEFNSGRALAVLGQSLTARGDAEAGRKHLKEAYTIFTELGVPEADDIHTLLATP